MNPSLLANPEVRVFWASLHQWPAGQSRFSPYGVCRLWLVLDGEIRLTATPEDGAPGQTLGHAPGHTLHLASGDVFLGSEQDYDIITPHGARWLSAGLRATAFTTFDLLQALQPPQVWHPDENARRLLETLLRTLVECWFGRPDYPIMNPGNLGTDELIARSHDAAQSLLCRSLGAALVGHCWQMHQASGADVSPVANAPGWLVAALRHFHDDPTSDVAAVAKEVGLSPAQFRRSFRKWTGSSPRDHLQSERLRTAQRLLETTDAPVATIAHEVGFKSCSHFIRLWQRSYGQPPAQHRAALRSAKV